MLFNSFEFLIFFPIVTIIYFLLPHQFRWIHLLIASCIFYMAFVPVYILILFVTIIVDYFAGIYIERSQGRQRKLLLAISIITNVGILAVFKYYNFFIENVNAVLHLPQNQELPFLNILLPIGLSFHTFQAMSYTIEVYRGHQATERHFGIYALYVMFYPQLVAGPIERPQNLLHQFREKHYFDIKRVYEGLCLMLWGLFKKIVIADRLSIYVDTIYGNIPHYSATNIALAVFFFSVQIYCDFSGYSDIAIGSAKVMGFKLMTNFSRPYFSKNIQEFWKRWHISLSTWFRDYVYISLGGNRVSKAKIYRNVIIVFLLSGFWHGAKWTFVIWGAIHALLITLYMLYREIIHRPGRTNFVYKIFSIVLTFTLVSLAWIFFRADSMIQAKEIFIRLFSTYWNFNIITKAENIGDNAFGFIFYGISFFMILLLIFNDYIQNVFQTSFLKKSSIDIFYNAAILYFIICFGVFTKTSFIYFQF